MSQIKLQDMIKIMQLAQCECKAWGVSPIKLEEVYIDSENNDRVFLAMEITSRVYRLAYRENFGEVVRQLKMLQEDFPYELCDTSTIPFLLIVLNNLRNSYPYPEYTGVAALCLIINKCLEIRDVRILNRLVYASERLSEVVADYLNQNQSPNKIGSALAKYLISKCESIEFTTSQVYSEDLYRAYRQFNRALNEAFSKNGNFLAQSTQ